VAAFCAERAPDVLLLSDIPAAGALQWVDEGLSDSVNLAYVDKAVSRDEGGATVHALWSSRPIATRYIRSDLTYRSGGQTLKFRNGILDVTLANPDGAGLRIIAVSVKDKSFHPAGQSEMRRNEARLVRNHVEETVPKDPQERLLILAALHDTPSSAPVRTLLEAGPRQLTDLRPLDVSAHAWTSHDASVDVYCRSHYVLTDGEPSERIEARLLDGPDIRLLSSARPIWITARANPP
jgi:hypothetical protein